MGYLFGTGIIGAITGGMSLLRGSREEPWTWRTALAWLSWGITLAFAIGAMVDHNRARRGKPVSPDSPEAEEQAKRARKVVDRY
jgi:hypothetical protein